MLIRELIHRIERLPTVETTDDVLARLPDWVAMIKLGWEYSADMMLGLKRIHSLHNQTSLEAVKKLEASLNAK